MNWDEPLRRLLARPAATTGQAVHWGLLGFRACLEAALQAAPDDPGAGDVRLLLEQLAWVQAPPAAACATALSAPTTAAPGPATAAGWLTALADEVRGHAHLRAVLGEIHLRSGSDADTWADLNHLFLRLPPPQDRQWRDYCVKRAEEVGARIAAPAITLPLPWTEEVYPALVGTVRAPGLATATAAPDDDHHLLAGVVKSCLWFAENDPSLGHALKSVYSFSWKSLRDREQARLYAQELLRRWHRVEAAPAPPPAPQACDWLKDRLDLDEAVHSLLHLPPAAPGSWWDRLRNTARLALFRARDRATGCTAYFQTLGGNFAAITRLADRESLGVPFGTPGEVVACLRVWARLNTDELKGRVLYRPPEGL
jgi:hypothetical protein